MYSLSKEEKKKLTALRRLLAPTQRKYWIGFSLKRSTGAIAINPAKNARILETKHLSSFNRDRQNHAWAIDGQVVFFSSYEAADAALDLIPWWRYTDRPNSLKIYSATVESKRVTKQKTNPYV